MRPGSSPRASPERGSLQRAVQLLTGEGAAELEPLLQLGKEVRDGSLRPQVERRVLADGRRLEPVGRTDHRTDEHANGFERLGSRPERVEHAQRLAPQLERLLDNPCRLAHPAAAQASFEIVHVRPREAGER